MSKYQVELSDGSIHNVPSDVRTPYESIKGYGLQAILERSERARSVNAARTASDVRIRAIIRPSGERVTTF